MATMIAYTAIDLPLKKFQLACIFCDSEKDIIEFRGKNVCPRCFQEMSTAFRK